MRIKYSEKKHVSSLRVAFTCNTVVAELIIPQNKIHTLKHVFGPLLDIISPNLKIIQKK